MTKEKIYYMISEEEYNEEKSKYIVKEIDNYQLMYRKKEENKKMLLWIPGYNDYYYHFHVGNLLLNLGYDIYALNMKIDEDNLNGYLEIINKVMKDLDKEYERKVLYGHNIGGLVCLHYVIRNRFIFDGLVLNGPLLDFYYDNKFEHLMKGFYSFIGKFRPNTIIRPNIKLPNLYQLDIQKRFYREKDKIYFNIPPLYAGWANTVSHFQQFIQQNQFYLRIPILVLTSNESSLDFSPIKDIKSDVIETEFILKNIHNRRLRLIKIKNAIHDVFVGNVMSSRTAMFHLMNWINHI